MRRRAVALVALLPLLAPVAAFALATLSPSSGSINFPSRCVRTSGDPQRVTVGNTGDEDALDIQVSISPSTHAGIFPLSGTTSKPSLGPDQEFSFDVGFRPDAAPTTSARAVIGYRSVVPPKKSTKSPSPDPSGGPPSESPSESPSPSPSPSTTPRRTTIPLTGSGIERFVATSPAALNFGAVRVGRAGSGQTITIFDDGDTTLTVSRVSLAGRNAGDFTIDTRGPLTVRDGRPVTIDIGFRARGVGGRLAEVVIESNSCTDATLRVPIAGIGVLPDVIASPQQVDLGSVKPGQRRRDFFEVLNQGGFRLNVESVEVTGEHADLVELRDVPSMPTRLQPGESFDVRVFFTAGEEPGPIDLTVQITSDDPDADVYEVPVVGDIREPPPSPTPSPTESALPPPPVDDGRGFSLPFGQYASELAIGVSVVGFFLFLVVLRRLRGIPE